MALSYLADRDGAPQQDLDDVLCIDARNVVVLLNELEGLGLTIRHRDPADRRRHRVQLTNSGREALSDAAHVHADIEEELLQALDADERATLRRLTASVLHAAEPHDDPAKAGSSLIAATIVAPGVDLAADEKFDTPPSPLDPALRRG